MAPSPTPNDTIIDILAFMENIWSTEVKYVEKRVIVKVVDRRKGWTVLRQLGLLTKPRNWQRGSYCECCTL